MITARITLENVEAETITAAAVLERIGFRSDKAGGGHSFDFGSLRLDALPCMSPRTFEDVVLFTGVWSDGRTIAQVQFETPDAFESFEQGVAWIADGLGRSRFRPASPVAWLDQGRAWRDRLPWVRSQAAYNARPNCTVGREWFRLPAARLRVLAENAEPEDLANFVFDGHVLTIFARSSALPMPAEGAAWAVQYAVLLSHLRGLPKRLMLPSVEVSVWEERLSVARLRIRRGITESDLTAVCGSGTEIG
jgi:hypothetical protein